jgi:Rrf2 family protein
MRLELTKRGAYAVRAMIALARLDQGTLMSSRRIAEEMHIPPRFLPQVMGDLTRAGLVEAQPGRSGGYHLAKDARDITILGVVDAVEPENRRQTCVLRGGHCGPEDPCEVHVVFFSGEDSLRELLGAATLAMVKGPRPTRDDLMKQYHELQAAVGQKAAESSASKAEQAAVTVS